MSSSSADVIIAPPRRESKARALSPQNKQGGPGQMPNQTNAGPGSEAGDGVNRRPSLSIVTRIRIDSCAKEDEGQDSASMEVKQYQSAPLPSPPPMSPTPMNPLQRLSNLASLMVYVIWFDVPLVSLLAEWNLPGNRYFKFRSLCERVLAATRLSPSVVVVGLKYLERVKSLLVRSRKAGEYPSSNGRDVFPHEGVVWATCLLLSHKYLDDKHYSNPVFAGVNNITATQLNDAEREALRLMNFQLAILEEEYIDWRKSLQGIVTESIRSIASPASASSPESSGGPATPGLLHPKANKRASPYQAPVSPGILAPTDQLWSPDSSSPGGPLRPRDKRRIMVLTSQKSLVPSSMSAPPRSSSFSWTIEQDQDQDQEDDMVSSLANGQPAYEPMDCDDNKNSCK
ncbi:MAG: hypothetical protein SGCHY_000519 [Lobulomycetales sp.]